MLWLKPYIIGIVLIIFVLITLITPPSSLAYLSTTETGEIVPANLYKLGIQPQFGTGHGSFNLSAFVDRGVDDSSSIRFLAGTGSTDFFTGFFYKYIPYPDFRNQPAIGFKVGGVFAREGDENILSARFHPIVSKKMQLEAGLAVPYVSLPLGFSAGRHSTTRPIHLVFGSDLFPSQFDKVSFNLELGLNMQDAFSYVAGNISVSFDNFKNIRFE